MAPNLEETAPAGRAPRIHGRIHVFLAGLLVGGAIAACAVGVERRGSDTTPAPSATAAPPTIMRAGDATLSIGWLPTTVTRHRAAIEAASKRHHVPADLLAIVALVESGGWVAARSPTGAIGLMQIMPATGDDIAKRRALSSFAQSQLDEPAFNVDFGAWYLARQLESFAASRADESVDRAAAAYNGGPGKLRRVLDGATSHSDETSRYIRWVGQMWRERGNAESETFAAWRAAGGDRLLARARAEMRAP